MALRTDLGRQGAQRALAAVLAAASLAAAWFLAAHHPVVPVLAAALVVLWAGIVWRWPSSWLAAVPALLPAMNFLPWTGWISFEEFDLLVLATAAGGYGRLASMNEAAGPRAFRMSRGARAFVVVLSLSTCVALVRGVADAGGPVLDWFGGYLSAMNSVRIAKSLVWALLLLPLLLHDLRRTSGRALDCLAAGVAAGLAVTALAIVHERAGYPGLLDFSTHYRATAWFWEMHVGGAALDGYLALAVPFGVWAVLEAKGRGRWFAGAALAPVVGYGVLTTFSRGLYLALPVGLFALGWLRLRRDGPVHAAGALPGNARLALAAGAFLTIQGAFDVGGYAGAAALVALAGVLMAVNGRRARPWWPARLRTQGGMLVVLLLITELVAVMEGGSLLAGRLLAGRQDFGSRIDHWRQAVGLLDGAEQWILGKGLGRLPAQYAAHAPHHELPADFRLLQEGATASVELRGPPGWRALAGLFGMTQRVSIVPGAAHVAKFDVRADVRTSLAVSVCERHLLYAADCLDAVVRVPPMGRWQHVEIALPGAALSGGPWYARRAGVFSVSVLGTGHAVRLDNLALWADGRQLLANGDFSAGLAHWFLGGQYYFQPWHADNWGVEVLLDQGIVGVAALAALVALALRRLVAGPARRHPLAPFLAAALVAHLVVGLFGSLMDAPRLAFLFFLLLWVALVLPGPAGGRPEPPIGTAKPRKYADSYGIIGHEFRRGDHESN